jgi:hypothetical protein
MLQSFQNRGKWSRTWRLGATIRMVRFENWLNEYLHLCDNEVYRSTMPKLDRTITDFYTDELYNPSFHIASALPIPTLCQL